MLDERAFSEVKRLCNAGLTASELLREIVSPLKDKVVFEAHCASTVDPASGLITHTRAEGMGGKEEAVLFFDRLYIEHELERLKRMNQEQRLVELLSEATGGYLERSLYYREMLVPLGYSYLVRVVFVDGGTLWGSMHMTREKGQPDFYPREATFLKRIASHLGAALKGAVLRSQALQATASPDSADVPGVLNIDHHGQVVWHTPMAERWLEDLGELEPGWREGIGLPVAVRMVMSALKRALDPETDADSNTIPRIRLRARSGRWLTLYGSLTEATSDRPSQIVVVIEPSKPEEMVWLNVTAYGLTPREEEILKLVVRGLSTRQISLSLYISEYTIQNHLRAIFEKAGVRSRRELVKKLFFECLYPSLSG